MSASLLNVDAAPGKPLTGLSPSGAGLEREPVSVSVRVKAGGVCGLELCLGYRSAERVGRMTNRQRARIEPGRLVGKIIGCEHTGYDPGKLSGTGTAVRDVGERSSEAWFSRKSSSMVGEELEAGFFPSFSTPSDRSAGTAWPLAVAHPIPRRSSETALSLLINKCSSRFLHPMAQGVLRTGTPRARRQ
jgi:hypothetical protein